MHEDFAKWYRICTTGTERDPIEDLEKRRWTGIESIIESDGREALELVRIALGRPSLSARYLESFKATFGEADPDFQTSGNEVELSVLAGSTLCQMFAEETYDADEAALGLLCAVGLGERREWISPFISHAEAYMEHRLRELRRPGKVPKIELPPENIRKLSQTQAAQVLEALKQLVDYVVSTTGTTASAIDQLDRESRFRKQESDVLWWLTAGVSRDTLVPFKDLEIPAASLIAGRELADLVSPPGIVPAKSILQRVVPCGTGKAKGKPIPLSTAVNRTDSEWRRRAVGNLKFDKIQDICPVLSAISRSVSTNEAGAWTSAYKKDFGIDPDTASHPVELAFKMHRECLLAKLAAAD